MDYISLSDEETRVIFSEEALNGLQSLDATQQEQVLKRLLSIVESEYPPTSFIHEDIANLNIITAGDKCRLYTKVIDNIPRDNVTYHIIYVFFIDIEHDYPQGKLAEYSRKAQVKLDYITNLGAVEEVEEYLNEHDALGEDDLRDMLS